jgi:hypothetical protein
MTIQQMHDWFDIVQDKYNTPYFISEEKDSFINRAQSQIVSHILFNHFDPKDMQQPAPYQLLSGVENTKAFEQYLYPIICDDIRLNASNGAISFQDLSTEINAKLNIPAPVVTFVLRVSRFNGTTAPVDKYSPSVEEFDIVEYVAQGRKDRMADNFFLKPKTGSHKYSYNNTGIKITLSSNDLYSISAIRNPIDVNYSLGINCELPVVMQERIMQRALNLAGVPTSDVMLLNFNTK